MRKIITSIAIVAFPVAGFAEQVNVDITEHWRVTINKDLIRGTQRCTLNVGASINTQNQPWIAFFIERKSAIPMLKGKYPSQTFRYKVDNSDVVELSNSENVLEVTGSEYEKMIDSFKGGNTLVIETSYPGYGTYQVKMSLAGFTKAYNVAKTCKP